MGGQVRGFRHSRPRFPAGASVRRGRDRGRSHQDAGTPILHCLLPRQVPEVPPHMLHVRRAARTTCRLSDKGDEPMSHSRSKRNWKPDSDLSYNCLCSAGRAPSATAPTAEWGVEQRHHSSLRMACLGNHCLVPIAQRSASFGEKVSHIGDAQEITPWSPHVDTLVSSQL